MTNVPQTTQAFSLFHSNCWCYQKRIYTDFMRECIHSNVDLVLFITLINGWCKSCRVGVVASWWSTLCNTQNQQPSSLWLTWISDITEDNQSKNWPTRRTDFYRPHDIFKYLLMVTVDQLCVCLVTQADCNAWRLINVPTCLSSVLSCPQEALSLSLSLSTHEKASWFIYLQKHYPVST